MEPPAPGLRSLHGVPSKDISIVKNPVAHRGVRPAPPTTTELSEFRQRLLRRRSGQAPSESWPRDILDDMITEPAWQAAVPEHARKGIVRGDHADLWAD